MYMNLLIPVPYVLFDNLISYEFVSKQEVLTLIHAKNDYKYEWNIFLLAYLVFAR